MNNITLQVEILRVASEVSDQHENTSPRNMLEAYNEIMLYQNVSLSLRSSCVFKPCTLLYCGSIYYIYDLLHQLLT